jgi:hypothetical protein
MNTKTIVILGVVALGAWYLWDKKKKSVAIASAEKAKSETSNINGAQLMYAVESGAVR